MVCGSGRGKAHGKDRMAKQDDDKFQLEATVMQALPNAQFKV